MNASDWTIVIIASLALLISGVSFSATFYQLITRHRPFAFVSSLELKYGELHHLFYVAVELTNMGDIPAHNVRIRTQLTVPSVSQQASSDLRTFSSIFPQQKMLTNIFVDHNTSQFYQDDSDVQLNICLTYEAPHAAILWKLTRLGRFSTPQLLYVNGGGWGASQLKDGEEG